MGSWMRLALRLGAAVGALAATTFLLLVHFQEKLIYVPRIPGVPSDLSSDPAEWGLDYEDVWLESDDGIRTHSWLVFGAPRGRRRWEAGERARGRGGRGGRDDGPGDAADEGVDRVNSLSSDEGWEKPPPATALLPTIVFFQENAGNMSARLHWLRSLVVGLHCNAFILGYRGYGDSEGSPTQEGLLRDARAALGHVRARRDLDASRIVLMGRSLGGAVALHTLAEERRALDLGEGEGPPRARAAPGPRSAAAEGAGGGAAPGAKPGGPAADRRAAAKVAADHAAGRSTPAVAGLVVENTFATLPEVVADKMPFLRALVGPGAVLTFLVRSPWDNVSAIRDLPPSLPVLLLSSLADEMLDPSQMVRLQSEAKAAGVRSQLVTFPGARHMDAYVTMRDAYWPALAAWLDDVVGPSRD